MEIYQREKTEKFITRSIFTHALPVLRNDHYSGNYTTMTIKQWLCKQRPWLGNDHSTATEEVFYVGPNSRVYHEGRRGKLVCIEWVFVRKQ
jgi:hypothetical protein